MADEKRLRVALIDMVADRTKGHDLACRRGANLSSAGLLAADSDERACEWQWAYPVLNRPNGFESLDLSAVSS
jgi:hypothetical protein